MHFTHFPLGCAALIGAHLENTLRISRSITQPVAMHGLGGLQPASLWMGVYVPAIQASTGPNKMLGPRQEKRPILKDVVWCKAPGAQAGLYPEVRLILHLHNWYHAQFLGFSDRCTAKLRHKRNVLHKNQCSISKIEYIFLMIWEGREKICFRRKRAVQHSHLDSPPLTDMHITRDVDRLGTAFLGIPAESMWTMDGMPALVIDSPVPWGCWWLVRTCVPGGDWRCRMSQLTGSRIIGQTGRPIWPIIPFPVLHSVSPPYIRGPYKQYALYN